MKSNKSRSTRRFNTVAVQTFVGGFVLAIYAVVGIYALDWDVPQVVGSVLPYFIFYELGILSRYIPGVRSAAKRLE